MRIQVRRDDIDDLWSDRDDGGNPGNAARQRHSRPLIRMLDFILQFLGLSRGPVCLLFEKREVTVA